MAFAETNSTYRRKNPLTNEWVLTSPDRLSRPWQGADEETVNKSDMVYDSNCYLCPGNTRANGNKNPEYKGIFTFVNDFSALLCDDKNEVLQLENSDELFEQMPASGLAKVICFSENHSLSMSSMPKQNLIDVISLWSNEVENLSKNHQWVQVFENKGQIMGCSNPHPHGQIWACNFLPTEGEKEELSQKQYYQKHSKNMLLEYIKREKVFQKRVVFENSDWIAVVPFWASWPFELLLLPKKHCPHLSYLNNQQQINLADALQQILKKYDKLFNCSFPYSMGWHGSLNAKDEPHWQLHAHFYPPLLRSATVKKHMVGFEMLSEKQRDITSEQAAKILRELKVC